MTAEPPERPGASGSGGDGRGTGAPEVGIFLVGAHGPGRTVEYARAAERAGFGAVWLAEHHFISYGQNPSATVLAGHILGATERIAVGTAACVLSARHPVALGEEAAMLDALAPGRFRLGVARGGPWVELEVFGTGHDRYQHGFPAGLDLLRRWLSGAGRVGGDSRWFRFREVTVVPRPVRPVPIWVAATSTSTMELAAVRGLPLLLGVQDGAGAKRAMLTRYAQLAADHGHDPSSIPHASAHLAYQGPVDRLRPRLREWLQTTRDYVRLDGAGGQRDLDAYTEHLLGTHPVGDPYQLEEIPGVKHVLLMVEAAGPETVDQIAALAGLRMPALRVR